MTQLNPNWMQNLTYSAQLDRQLVQAQFNEGVLTGTVVSQRAAGGTAMFVDVAVGTGIINGDDQTNQGSYLVTCSVLETLAIAAAPGSQSRIDLVYWRVNDPNAGGPAGNTSAFGVVTGTVAGSPVQPALPTSAIPLAAVVVASGTVAITNAMITDLRNPAYMKGGNVPGEMTAWPLTEAAVPADKVLCRGQSLNRLTDWRPYRQSLQGGGTWPHGSTSTTYTVPDMRGRVPVGLDNMGGSDAGVLNVVNTLGATGGEQLHTLTTGEMASHSHVVNSHSHGGLTGDENALHYHPVNITSGGGGSHNHQPANGANFQTATGTGSGYSNGLSTVFTGESLSTNTNTVGNHTHPVVGDTSTQSVLHKHPISAESPGTNSEGGGSPHNVMQPYMLVNWVMQL